MRPLILTIVIFSSLSVFGQDTNLRPGSEELDELYLLAMAYRIDLALQSGLIYFENTENTERIKDRPELYFRFYSRDELTRKALKAKKTITAMRVVHSIISKDTVDFNFGKVFINAKRRIHFDNGLRFVKSNFSVACGGTIGNSPDMRFVYDEKANEWKIIINRFIRNVESKITTANKLYMAGGG